jgi:hypothetical protein
MTGIESGSKSSTGEAVTLTAPAFKASSRYSLTAPGEQ